MNVNVSTVTCLTILMVCARNAILVDTIFLEKRKSKNSFKKWKGMANNRMIWLKSNKTEQLLKTNRSQKREGQLRESSHRLLTRMSYLITTILFQLRRISLQARKIAHQICSNRQMMQHKTCRMTLSENYN